MSGIWVYKDDGTKQCGWGKEIPLAEMEKQLATLIGQGEILGREKRVLPRVFPEMCGGPTGRVNAYRITEKGLYMLFHGFVGPHGFKLWMWPAREAEGTSRGGEPVGWVPFPLFVTVPPSAEAANGVLVNALAGVSQAGAHPVLIRELIGHPVRYYAQGDGLTMDYRPERVNIEHDDKHVITSIWFG